MRIVFVVIYFAHTIEGIERHPPNQNPSRQQQQQQQQQQLSGQMKVRQCERIEIEMCRELGYNITGMPNFVGHETQRDAEQQLTTFTPLIQYGCSSRLRFFLCSVYVPMCSEKAIQPIGPCAPLCETVRRRCEPVLMQFGFPWPLALNCSRFLPRNEDDSMCIEVPSEEEEEGEGGRTTTANRAQAPETAAGPHTTTTAAAETGSSCDIFRNPSNYVPLNRTRQCALLCSRDDVFSADQKLFADAWMSVWTGLCFVTTFVAILIFLIDMRRFAYPERAIVYVAVCYNVCSVGYLVRLIGGREAIACREVPESKKVVVREGIENTECTFVFLLVYYFSMAGSIWCLVLTVLWFLNSGLERPYDSLARHGTLLHLIAWSVPSAAAIAVVVMRGVDADELTAMCHVGYHSQTTQLAFVLVPTAVLLLAGVVFFGFGLACSLRRCSEARREGRRPDRKTGPTTAASSSPIRIGAFLLVNLVLTVCALSVQCYEYANRQQWPLRPPSGGTDAAVPAAAPNVGVLMLGVAVNLTVGIVSAVWLWRGESVRSCQRFCSRLSRCCCPRTRPKQQQQRDPASSATATPNIARLQTPLATARGRPIYRVTTEAYGRNGSSRHFTVPLKSSHHCRRHHHHYHHQHQPHHDVSLSLETRNSPPPPPPPSSYDKSSSRSPLRRHDLSSDVSML